MSRVQNPRQPWNPNLPNESNHVHEYYCPVLRILELDTCCEGIGKQWYTLWLPHKPLHTEEKILA